VVAVLLAAAVAGLAVPPALAQGAPAPVSGLQAAPPPPAVPLGVWLMDARVAVQIFDCEEMMCGRIVWLAVPRDSQGALDPDKKNPDMALRQRLLCGLTILWNLRPAGPDRWKDGWFYNPDDGKTYRVSAHLQSADVLVARIYVGIPLFGRTKTLARVPHLTSEGWCGTP
jgi:uncharacterized protein (DUF2147 family)